MLDLTTLSPQIHDLIVGQPAIEHDDVCRVVESSQTSGQGT